MRHVWAPPQVWFLYDPVAQMARMKVPAADWRITDINADYKVCRVPAQCASLRSVGARHHALLLLMLMMMTLLCARDASMFSPAVPPVLRLLSEPLHCAERARGLFPRGCRAVSATAADPRFVLLPRCVTRTVLAFAPPSTRARPRPHPRLKIGNMAVRTRLRAHPHAGRPRSSVAGSRWSASTDDAVTRTRSSSPQPCAKAPRRRPR